MVTTPHCWTVDDLDCMPDDGGWKRHELIRGKLFMPRAPHIRHQSAAGKIHVRLEFWSEETSLDSAFQMPGVVFSPTDAVIPDIVWISRERLMNGMDEAGHLTVAPELIVEILSPGDKNEQRDREFKRKLYSVYGVQEYWIANWQLQTLEVYRRKTAQLQIVNTLMMGDNLTSPLLPEFLLPITKVFQ